MSSRRHVFHSQSHAWIGFRRKHVSWPRLTVKNVPAWRHYPDVVRLLRRVYDTKVKTCLFLKILYLRRTQDIFIYIVETERRRSSFLYSSTDCEYSRFLTSTWFENLAHLSHVSHIGFCRIFRNVMTEKTLPAWRFFGHSSATLEGIRQKVRIRVLLNILNFRRT